MQGSVYTFSVVYGKRPRTKVYSDEDLRALVKILSKFKSMSRWRMQTQLFWETGTRFRDSTIQRMIKEIDWTCKKITIVEFLVISVC